jgi:hypothetical protein
MPAGKGFGKVTRAEGGIEHDMLDAGFLADVEDVAFEFDELRNRRAYKIDSCYAVESFAETWLVRKVCQDGLASRGRLGGLFLGTKHSADVGWRPGYFL